MSGFVGAIDQGTTSTRFVVVDGGGRIQGMDQREHRQIYPRPGWVEHDPDEIWQRTVEVIEGGLAAAGIGRSDLAAVGITNQRETTVVWDASSGRALANAIVWQDTRTAELCRELSAKDGPDRWRAVTGLPVATYFSGPKVRWLLDHDESVAAAAAGGEARFGTIDSWLVWKLTGRHLTDVTNASRTLLMDLGAQRWDERLVDEMGVPGSMLPDIRSSSELYGMGRGPLQDVPITGILGDQQAALFGQTGFAAGAAKNTYGTGCFLLVNTGTNPVPSSHGLLSTVAFRLGEGPAHFALEGSVAVAGAAVQWLRDNLGVISRAGEVEDLARSVPDNGDVYFVPAFSGLFAPYWRSDARGVLVGLTRFATAGHLARATLEATAFQTRDLVEAMEADAGMSLEALRVDGGMTANGLLMQFQADLLGVPVILPTVSETTVLGAAFAAGLAIGVWSDTDELTSLWSEGRRWVPEMTDAERDRRVLRWKQAVERTLGWVE